MADSSTLNLSREEVRTSELEGLNEDQRQRLIKAAESVCKITIVHGGKRWTGTGFHFGGGWVMTNYHVVVDAKAARETFRVSEASFKFPGIAEPIPGKIRSFFCTHFENWKENVARSTRKDLALIYVPELLGRDPQVLGLYNIHVNIQDEHPPEEERVYMIHYGGSGAEQFSFGRITKIDFKSTETEQKFYIEHNACCPGGSSGAPVLWFNRRGDPVLCAVNYVGTKDNMKGDALLYRAHHWLRGTLTFASTITSDSICRYKTLATKFGSSDLGNVASTQLDRRYGPSPSKRYDDDDDDDDDDDLGKSAVKSYSEQLRSLNQEAVERHILVFLDCENLPNLQNVKSAY